MLYSCLLLSKQQQTCYWTTWKKERKQSKAKQSKIKNSIVVCQVLELTQKVKYLTWFWGQNNKWGLQSWGSNVQIVRYLKKKERGARNMSCVVSHSQSQGTKRQVGGMARSGETIKRGSVQWWACLLVKSLACPPSITDEYISHGNGGNQKVYLAFVSIVKAYCTVVPNKTVVLL